MRDHAHTLSDFLVPTLSIECEPCGRRGRYNVAKLIEQYGDAKLPELRGEMDRTMVTAGYVILLIGLVAAVGWGLWQLLAEFNREIDE
jgi:hypothetical protein